MHFYLPPGRRSHVLAIAFAACACALLLNGCGNRAPGIARDGATAETGAAADDASGTGEPSPDAGGQSGAAGGAAGGSAAPGGNDAGAVDTNSGSAGHGLDAGTVDATGDRGSDAGTVDAAADVSMHAGATGDAADAAGLPHKIVGGYYPNWTPAPLRVRDINAHYNLIYLFNATPVGGAPGTTGAITFDLPGDGRGAATHFKEDIAYARATQRRTIIMSVGGAGNGMSFPNRTKSQTFVDSFVALSLKYGPFDGLDWNTFEANQAPDTAEMIWISQQLKAHFPGFLISAPPAPWNQRDKDFCKAMVTAGVMDYAAPQYYDGPGLATQAYVTTSVKDWAKLLGASHVVVGFGIWDQPNYMNITDAVSTWKAVIAADPALRGAFDWQIHTDETQGWPFADKLGPLVAP